jgi:diacylglycerol O-acyltransferase / wax synthase
VSGINHDDEAMSSSDALIWHIERDPLLRSTIMSVWFLDKPPTPARMQATTERMVSELPRLRQRVVEGRPHPRWVTVDDLDIAAHYEYHVLDGEASRDDVMARAQEWVNQPFDRNRPLWQLGIFSGLAGGKGALVLKVHHAIADGVGFVLMLAALADLEPNPLHRPKPPADVVSLPAARRARRSPAKMLSLAVSSLLRRPIHSVKTALRSIASIAKLVMPASKPLSSLMSGRNNELRLDTKTVPTDTLRFAAKQAGGSLNDAFVSLVLDAIDRYHGLNAKVCGKVRIHMPINIRHTTAGDRSGNQFVPARIVMAAGGDHTEGRLRRVSSHLAAVRQEPALPWVNNVSAAIQRLGVPISRRIIGGMMKGVDVLASNVPGPPCPLYLAGVHVDEFYAFGPPAGAALNVTLFSYHGTVSLGVTTDAAAIPSRDLFMHCLDEAIADMQNLAAIWTAAQAKPAKPGTLFVLAS